MAVEKKLIAPQQNQLRNNLEEEESSQEFMQLQSINNTDVSDVEKESSIKVKSVSQKKHIVDRHVDSTLRLTNGELWGRDFQDVAKVEATLNHFTRIKSGNYPNSAPRVYNNLTQLKYQNKRFTGLRPN